MIEYYLNGAWGKTVPDERLTEVLLDLGIDLKVEPRPDKLYDITLVLDDVKLKRRRRRSSKNKKV